MEQIYLLLNQSQKVPHPKVTLEDACTIFCQNKTLQSQIRKLKIHQFPEQNSSGSDMRIIFTAIKLIEIITEAYPDVTVVPIGDTDIILELDTPQKPVWLTRIKTTFICLIVFFGSAFSIMAFNNDVNVNGVFVQLYQMLSGKESPGFTMLEFGYSAGLFVGIIIFYNHFGKRKLSRDPTPLEIEMRLYENDINTTLIDGVKRKNEHIDVE